MATKTGQATDWLLPTAYCLLLIADCLLATADCVPATPEQKTQVPFLKKGIRRQTGDKGDEIGRKLSGMRKSGGRGP